MNNGQPANRPKPAEPEKAENTSSPSVTGNPAAGATPPATPLTAEEQMALYEKELKETDWGHQPC